MHNNRKAAVALVGHYFDISIMMGDLRCFCRTNFDTPVKKNIIVAIFDI